MDTRVVGSLRDSEAAHVEICMYPLFWFSVACHKSSSSLGACRSTHADTLRSQPAGKLRQLLTIHHRESLLAVSNTQLPHSLAVRDDCCKTADRFVETRQEHNPTEKKTVSKDLRGRTAFSRSSSDFLMQDGVRPTLSESCVRFGHERCGGRTRIVADVQAEKPKSVTSRVCKNVLGVSQRVERSVGHAYCDIPSRR